MKYLTTCLSLMVTSVWANEDLRVCLADTEMNPGNRFTHEVITTDVGDYKVVNDAATGLQWSYCFIGQTLSSDQMSCVGEPTVAMDLFPERKFYPNVREKTLEIVEAENQRLGSLTIYGICQIRKIFSLSTMSDVFQRRIPYLATTLTSQRKRSLR